MVKLFRGISKPLTNPLKWYLANGKNWDLVRDFPNPAMGYYISTSLKNYSKQMLQLNSKFGFLFPISDTFLFLLFILNSFLLSNSFLIRRWPVIVSPSVGQKQGASSCGDDSSGMYSWVTVILQVLFSWEPVASFLLNSCLAAQDIGNLLILNCLTKKLMIHLKK